MPGDVEVFVPDHISRGCDPNTYVRGAFTPLADNTAPPSGGDIMLAECGSRVTSSYGGGAATVDGAVYLVGGRSDRGVSDKVLLLWGLGGFYHGGVLFGVSPTRHCYCGG